MQQAYAAPTALAVHHVYPPPRITLFLSTTHPWPYACSTTNIAPRLSPFGHCSEFGARAAARPGHVLATRWCARIQPPPFSTPPSFSLPSSPARPCYLTTYYFPGVLITKWLFLRSLLTSVRKTKKNPNFGVLGMFAMLVAATSKLNIEDHYSARKDLLEKPKNIVAILDCGPMADDCNELQDGGDYY